MPQRNLKLKKFKQLLERMGNPISAACLKKLQEPGCNLLQVIAELFGFVPPASVVINKIDMILIILEWIKGKSSIINNAVIRNTPIGEIDVRLYQNIVSIIDRRLLRNALKASEYAMLQTSFQNLHRITLDEFFSGTIIILNGTREMQLTCLHMIVQDATKSMQPEQLLVVMTRLNARLHDFRHDYVIRSFNSGGVIRLFEILAPYLKMFFETSMQQGAHQQFKILLAETYRLLHNFSQRFRELFRSEGHNFFVCLPSNYGFPDLLNEYPEYLAAQHKLLM
jgi:hypothetical protein